MDSQDLSSPPHMDASRPSLGFPLGTALLLIIILSLSGIFSCCYHWDRFRSLRHSFSQDDPDHHTDIEASPSKSKPICTNQKQNQSQSLPVLMPGDRIPKFIALPCPREPPRPEKVVVKVQKPLKPPPRLPVPLY
ncbi:hypothetical protein I3843_07G041100 [Carya illinoinensis]|uniref:Hydroxyproline-rich glycoprotein family protein n=1 Tax=Carya illinoinensis TaxID=32201 RepID=A0A8T1PXJ0_CARIL|nr:uncharacterized protein At5g65660-like [Carya illinoinensis]KAG2696045.1 hypothetical protein I3760_07G040500 [Carya illinoinensis]KAG6646918.1 hypothetical protein CIPAW_07G041900 [Carya illinoinensis]KAG6702577.1 hypothetical protein I3842_07G041800 [Carya illinoinensis]KAG7969639.1 hypothetical protein I3843_07G041100 [Carya illinoinensis]